MPSRRDCGISLMAANPGGTLCNHRPPSGRLPGGLQRRDWQLRQSRGRRRSTARAPLLVAAWGFGRKEAPLEPGRLFVFGLGYSGLGAANYFLQRGWEVAGTCRSEGKCARLAERGIQAFHFDPAEFDNLGGHALDALKGATHVLSTVPPDDADHSEPDPVIFSHAQSLSEGAERYSWVGYVSSTSVYGDWQGEWVDEESELRATGGKGWSRVLAEHEWLALHDNFGLPVHVFRCGGIYGPRRSALEALQRGGGGGTSASADRRALQRYTARCHVFDICQTLEASMRHPRPGAAYNIADDDPAPRSVVMDFAADLLQRRAAGELLVGPGGGPGGEWALPAGGMPGGATTSSSSGSYDSDDAMSGLAGAAAGRSRPRERMGRGEARQAAALAVRETLAEKRVKNERIKSELGVRLLFPTYREGLAAIAAGDKRPFD